MVATMLSIEQSMHWWPLMQMHTTPKLLHMESASDPTYQGNFCICSFTDSRREISHRAEGVSAISVIPQGDLRLLQQAVQQEALPRMPAYSA